MNTVDPLEQRTNFIGRIQEQRQFKMILPMLLAHHHRWRDLADQLGHTFDPDQAPLDESYPRIFLLHGIGGIGKSWLTRRCLALAHAQTDAYQPPLLTLYDDLSLGAPVLEPVELINRIYSQLASTGYGPLLAAFKQSQANIPRITERVNRYRVENLAAWETFTERSSTQLSEAGPGDSAAVLAGANELLLTQMGQEGLLTAEEINLFLEPSTVLAGKLVNGFKRIAQERPLIIALDNLEVVVPLEPFIRDLLVMPTIHLPMLWILSGRHNLADERVVEVAGHSQAHKGFRDLLGENPPLVWDMSSFGDADLYEFLEAESHRRQIPLKIDDNLIAAVKTTSSGVPLVVEMVADALFTLSRDEFLQNFVVDDRTLLPAGRLEQITARFLRHCLTRQDDMERVQGMALLRRGADEAALEAVWALEDDQPATQVLAGLQMRYAFVQADGLHDAVYEFVRRQLHTVQKQTGVRDLLSRRAVDHYQTEWTEAQEISKDPAILATNSTWQAVTRDLLNAFLWTDPDEAMHFFLPRFVEGLNFARPFAEELLPQVEGFLAEEERPALLPTHLDLLPQLRAGLADAGWLFNEPGESVGQMIKILLARPGWESLHFSLLHLWQGNWLAGQEQFGEALAAYLTAEENLPDRAATLQQQLGQAFYQVSSRFLWPDHPTEPVPSDPGLQAARRAVTLIPDDGPAWYNLGVALAYLGRETEAIPAYQKAIEIEPRATYYNDLADTFSGLLDYEPAIAAYRQAIELDRTYAWPYHGLAVIYSEQGQYELALDLYQQAIERHSRDVDQAASWDGLGDIYVELGHYDGAIEAYRQAIALSPKEALTWYSLGNVYTTLERYDEAIEPYRRAIELDPAYPWSYHNLGLVYERRGELAPAMILFQQAIERQQRDPARAQSWNSLGDVYSALGRNQEAITAYRQAIDLDPGFALPWNSLGREYSLAGQYEEAIRAYQQVVELTPEEALAWYSLGNAFSAEQGYDEAMAAYRQAIELGPNEAWPYNNLGFVYQKLGRFNQATELYQQALERHEDGHSKAVTWDNLGNAYRASRNHEEAISAYRWARMLAPDYAWPYHNLGTVHGARGEYETAIPYFQQAIERHERDQDRAAAWNSLGDAYHALDRLEEAIHAYQRVIELNPKFALSWYSLGNVYRQLDQQAAEQGEIKDRSVQIIEAYRRAIELDPSYGWPYHNLGLIYEQRQAYDEALRLFRQAFERHRNDADRAISWTKVGDIYRVRTWTSLAIDVYKQATELDPTYPWPYHQLALIYQERRQYEEAVPLFQQAISQHVQSEARAQAWNHLGNVYRALSRHREAIGAYRQAIELKPDFALPWSSVGDVCRLLDRPDEAIDAYRQAVDLDPALAWPYHNLALIYTERGETDRTACEAAIILYRQAIERHQSDRERALAWNHLGNTYRTLHRLEDAIKAYRQAIELDPDYTSPWNNLGDVYRALSYPEDAIDAYRHAIELAPQNVFSWNSLGDVYRGMERFEEAIEAYRQAVKINPAYAWPYDSLGLIYEQQGRYELAVPAYRQAAERHARRQDQAVVWNRLGNIYRQSDRSTAAIEAYQQAIDLDPDFAWPHHNLGLIYEQQGEAETALNSYRQAIRRHRSDRDRVVSWHKLGGICLGLNRYTEAIDAYQRVIELDPQDSRSWNSLGMAHSALEHYEAAIKAFEQAIGVDPDDAWPYHNLGFVYEKRESYETAIPYYRQAVERHQNELDAAATWNSLGGAYYALQRYDEAIEAYRQSVMLDPNNALPWDSLGDVYAVLGRYQEAAQAYQRAIDLDSDYAWPYHNLALVYAKEERYQEALPLYHQAIERHINDQDRALSWNNLGKVHHALGNQAEAVQAYQQSIDLNSTYAWPYNNLGVVFAGQGEYEPAITLYRQALERHTIDRDKAVSWDNLGNVLSTLGRYDEAIEAYRQAVTLDTAFVLPWNSLGNVYQGLKRYPEAIEAYQQAIELDPEYALPWNGLGDVYRAQGYGAASGQATEDGRAAQAIAAYRRAIELNPDYAWPYHSLGIIYEQQGNYDSALTYYRQAIERHTVDAPKALLWHNVGNVYRATGQPQEALGAFRQAIALDSNFAPAWFGLGNIFSDRAQSEEAIEAYRRSIELEPTDARVYHNLALVYEAQDQYDLAVDYYKLAIERQVVESDRAISWHNLGTIYHQRGRYQEAIAALRRAAELDPTSPLPWNSLGNVYKELEQPQQTIRAYRRAIQLDPTYAQPYNNLGFFYEQLGQYEEAMTLYRQVIEQHPSHKDRSVSWNNLGNIYRHLKQEKEAIEAYQQAIKLDPDYSWPYQNLGAIFEARDDYEEALAYYQRAIGKQKQD